MTDGSPFLLQIEKQWNRFSLAWKKAKRGKGLEKVHALRSATRRLAALLILLQAIVDDERIEHIQRQFEKLQKRLGPIRDAQVQLRRIQRNPAASFRPIQASVKKSERKKGRKLEDYLTDRRKKAFKETLKDVQDKAQQVLEEASSSTIDRKIRPVINDAIADVAAAQAAVSKSDPASLHALRRASRQLRYLLESGVVPNKRAPAGQLKKLRSFQSALGDIRDLQLLEDEIRQISKDVKNEQDRADIDRYCRALARQRIQKLKAFSL